MQGFNWNLTGEGSIQGRLHEMTTKDIKEIKKSLVEIKTSDTKEQLHELEKLITSSGKEFSDVQNGEYTDSQKAIKEKYISLQKENLDSVRSESKIIKKNVKMVEKDISRQESEIGKMIGDINHVVKNTFVFKDAFRIKKEQSRREASIGQEAETFVLNTEVDIMQNISKVKIINKTQSELANTIEQLKTKHQEENNAFVNRFKLSGEVDKAISDIDNTIKEHKKLSKHSSPDLVKHLEDNVFPKLEAEKSKLQDLNHKLINSEFKDTKSEEQLIKDLKSELATSNDSITNLTNKATEALSVRPRKSTLSREGKISKLGNQRFSIKQVEKSKSETNINSINMELGTQIRSFNLKLNEFAVSNLNSENNPGEIYSELEVLKSQIDNTMSKIKNDQVNKQNLDNYKYYMNFFDNLSNLENPKLESAKFIYIELEKSIVSSVYTTGKAVLNLIELENSINNENDDKKVKDLNDKKLDYKKRVVNDLENNILINYGVELIKKGNEIPEGFSETVADYNKILDSLKKGDLSDVNERSKSFSVKRMSPTAIGDGIQVAYGRFVETVAPDIWQLSVNSSGFSKAIPNIESEQLETLYSAMEHFDTENKEKYQEINDSLKSLSGKLNELKNEINKKNPQDAKNSINELVNIVNIEKSKIENMEFGLTDKNKFILDGKEASFGEFNKKSVSGAYSSIINSLQSLDKYIAENDLPPDKPLFTKPQATPPEVSEEKSEPQVTSEKLVENPQVLKEKSEPQVNTEKSQATEKLARKPLPTPMTVQLQFRRLSKNYEATKINVQAIRISDDKNIFLSNRGESIFEIRDQAEDRRAGTGMRLNFDPTNNTLTINRKPADQYSPQVLLKANNLIKTINENYIQRPMYLDQDKKIESAYTELINEMKKNV